MFTEENRAELSSKGVTVVPSVISEVDCDRHQQYFRDWLSKFPSGQWPQSNNSLIQSYKSGHLQPAWEARLAAKPVFAEIWGTKKLLSSMDAIAIGRPPEEGEEKFWSPDNNTLHVDQKADRVGLHAYQGAVYLEECAEDDWTFEVIEGSHKHFDQFMEQTGQWRCRNVKSPDLAWFEGKGCYRRRVPCPKGGMVLWDSRLFHSSARPLEGRQHPGRWRFVVFVCMTPSAWATPSDLETKRKAYTDLELTKHWPSQRVRIFTGEIDPEQAKDPIEMHVLPEVAKTDEARRLAGVLPYGEENDDSNGDGLGQAFTPVWDKEKWVAHIEEHKKRKRAEEKKRAESIQS
ncbi:phytanoyl-coa dioxygenase phyh [Plakobranchus ocellatus]|uniref:Phytanoyl-coa dioxygenase phyh n=1 Tax=Plakobranchus ocellatus TaxID=259542 RepID=A0AAV3YQ44_9GAST|nr:phytanoyl-coa dioxygenase phyh [Plakobranchus ocellatus]